MDKFVVKTLSASSQEKKRLRPHIHVNSAVNDRARKYPEGTFHVDDSLLFCSSCNMVVDHLRKFVTLRLSHTSGTQEKNGKPQTLT